MELLERFISYVKVDTMADDTTGVTPSTKKQFNLGKQLVKELKDLGLKDASINDKCMVTATLPTNCDSKLTIGFLAHIDTIPDFSGTNVNPQVIKNYDGKDITLKNNVTLSLKQFPYLSRAIGKTIITTDGTTVLGSDDKAGIADIMNMLEFFVNNKEVKHVTIKVAFTPDEEIGLGIHQFDVNNFKCDFAYTSDGGPVEYINYECFNAASAKVHISGRNIHPGSAKGQMINSAVIATEFEQMLPKKAKPMYTDNYEGFFHLCDIRGDIASTDMEYIIRDHDMKKFMLKKQLFCKNAAKLNQKYGKDVVSVSLRDQYTNMAEDIKKDMTCVNRAKLAASKIGIKLTPQPIRGGTDGSYLTSQGLRTPNLGTGGYNCHGPYEYAILEEMQKVTDLLVEIAKEN